MLVSSLYSVYSSILSFLAKQDALSLLFLLCLFIITIKFFSQLIPPFYFLLKRNSTNNPQFKIFPSINTHPTYSIAELKGRRPYMEDRHLVLQDIDKEHKLFGVFDGHGGSQAAEYCINNFSEIFSSSSSSNLTQRLTSTFLELDKRFLNIARARRLDVGTTALVSLVSLKKIIVANTGDSRSVLIQEKNGVNKVKVLSVDHKPDFPSEKKRIEKAGGNIIHWGVWRVEGILALSRAIGDKDLKHLVIPDPDIFEHPRNSEDKWLILASDGLWDVYTNEQVAAEASTATSSYELAGKLTKNAYVKGTMDNVTVIVIDLRFTEPVAVSTSSHV
eukprot:maker-scaffold_21-snap-gene-2.3-mRNA-1 protein AED:0.02 eAED:0.02 QI:438/1/1/1/0.5/0.2/5/1014/331